MPTNTDSDAAWKEALNAPEMGRLIDRIRRREFTDGPRPGAKAAKDYTVEEVENILIRNYRLQFGTVANLKAKSPKGKGENVFGDVNRVGTFSSILFIEFSSSNVSRHSTLSPTAPSAGCSALPRESEQNPRDMKCALRIFPSSALSSHPFLQKSRRGHPTARIMPPKTPQCSR